MKKKWLQHDPEKDQSLENFVAWTEMTIWLRLITMLIHWKLLN